MHRTETKASETRDSPQGWDRLVKVLQASKAMKTRFQLLEKSTNVVVAGLKDTELASNGLAKGWRGFIVRFNNPNHGRSYYHRIAIDSEGFPRSVDAHIPVSSEVIKAAEVVQKGLEISVKALFIISIVASGIRVSNAIYEELDVDSQIEALQNIVDDLKKDLRDSTEVEKPDIEESLKFAEHLLENARDCKQNPGKKTLLTSLCVAGEWCGAAAMACAGAQGGAALGAMGGPVGSIAGAATGSLVGCVAGSSLGATAVENFRVDQDGAATDMHGSLLSFGDKYRYKVMNVDANVFLGKGLEVGARGAFLQIQDHKVKRSFAVVKAGISCGLSNKGIDLSTEGKVAWLEYETDFGCVGYGMNVDTGVKITEQCKQVSVLGLGFSKGSHHFGLKTPFFNITWRNS